MSERITMVDVYMLHAKVLSLRSTCKRAQFGCVITDKTLERVWSVGYNGAPKGFSHDTCTGEEGWCGCSHAEMNALVKVAGKDNQKVMFTTGSPCKTCANLTINSGISKLYYLKGVYRSDEGLDLIKKAGIVTEAVDVTRMLSRLHVAKPKPVAELPVEEVLEEPEEPPIKRVRQIKRDDLPLAKVCERTSIVNGECICRMHNLPYREPNEMDLILTTQLKAVLR